MDFESCNPAAQFAIQQSQNSFVIPNATPFIEFDLNVLATGHVGLTIRIFDVTQPLSFAVFNRVPLKGKISILHNLWARLLLCSCNVIDLYQKCLDPTNSCIHSCKPSNKIVKLLKRKQKKELTFVRERNPSPYFTETCHHRFSLNSFLPSKTLKVVTFNELQNVWSAVMMSPHLTSLFSRKYSHPSILSG